MGSLTVMAMVSHCACKQSSEKSRYKNALAAPAARISECGTQLSSAAIMRARLHR